MNDLQANEATLRRIHREIALDEQKKLDKKLREKDQLARMTRENDALLVLKAKQKMVIEMEDRRINAQVHSYKIYTHIISVHPYNIYTHINIHINIHIIQYQHTSYFVNTYYQLLPGHQLSHIDVLRAIGQTAKYTLTHILVLILDR